MCVSTCVYVSARVCECECVCLCMRGLFSPPQSKVVIELLENLLDADIPPASIGNHGILLICSAYPQ